MWDGDDDDGEMEGRGGGGTDIIRLLCVHTMCVCSESPFADRD